MARRFEYRGTDRTAEDVTRRRGRGGYDSYIEGDFPIIKVTEGQHNYRILPPTWIEYDKNGKVVNPDVADRWGNGWEIKIYLHFGVGSDNGAYLCSEKMNGEDCPVCQARLKAADEDERKALRAAECSLAWVVDRDNERAGPQIWRIPNTLLNDILGRSIDKKSNRPVPIDDPEEGYDVSFVREGSDEKTKYAQVDIERDPSPLHKDEKQQDRWLDYISDNPLPSLLKFFEFDYIEKLLMGGSSRDDEGGSRGGRVRSRREPEPEPEEPRRGRGRRDPEPEADPEPVEPRGGRGRDRGRAGDDAGESDPEPRSGRRGREPDPSDDPDAAVEARSSRGRGREPVGESDEDPPGERSGRSGRSRGREPEPEPEEPRRGRGRRDPEPEAEDEPAPTRTARAALNRVSSRRG